VTADYTYDGLERMAIRTTQNMTPAGTTHYLYDRAGRLLVEADDTGQTLREYVWLDDMPLAVVSDVNTMSPNLYFVHADHLDTPVRMTDVSKNVVWDAYFLPFGTAESITGSASNNMRFPGQYFLIEDGLHYNWYRHYDSTLGRYVQADPLANAEITIPAELRMKRLRWAAVTILRESFLVLATNGQISSGPTLYYPRSAVSGSRTTDQIDEMSLGPIPNLYAYANGNPISYQDPTGLAAGDLLCEGFSGGCQSGGSYGTTAMYCVSGLNLCRDCAVKILGLGSDSSAEQTRVLRPFGIGGSTK
jgi:RHS repeat-associated protein